LVSIRYAVVKKIPFLFLILFSTNLFAESPSPLSFKFTDRIYEFSETQDNALMHISLMTHIGMKLEEESLIHEEDIEADTDLLIDFHLFDRSITSSEQYKNKTQRNNKSHLDFMIVVYWNNEEMDWREPLYYKDSLGVQIDSAKEKVDFSVLTAEILSAMIKKEQLYLSSL